MFEQVLLPSGRTHQSRNTLLVFVAQLLVVAFVVVGLPLIFVAKLPQVPLVTELIAPPLPAPPPPPPPPAAAYKAPKTPPATKARVIVPRRFVAPRLIAPRTIPQLPAMAAIAPPPLAGIAGGVTGGVAGGIPGGVPGGTLGGEIGSIAPPAAPPKPPAKPATATATIRVGGKVQEARLLHEVVPAYPAIAKEAHVSGVVRLSATIAPNGTVEDLHVVSGNPLLVDAAMTAVKQWTYKPTYLNGKPVQVLTDVDVKFNLG